MSDQPRFPSSKMLGTPPPEGYGVVFSILEDRSIETVLAFTDSKEGPPGLVHGGALAAVMDEAMGAACVVLKRTGYTVTMQLSYKKAVPLNAQVTIRGRVIGTDGARTFTSASLTLPDGTLAVEATGVFFRSQALQDKLATHYGYVDHLDQEVISPDENETD